MARRKESTRGYKIVALLIAILLWGVAHGASEIERGFDVPVVFQDVPTELVITDKNSDVINIRVRGSRAAMRNLQGERLEYEVNVSGARQGSADFDVPQEPIDPPRGAEVVARSPAQLEVKFERRGTKVMPVRADVSGEPAPGHRVAAVEVEPARIRVSGARREVLRLREAVTEGIDITGSEQTIEREVRVNLGGQHVWVDEPTTVRVRVVIEADAKAEENPAG